MQEIDRSEQSFHILAKGWWNKEQRKMKSKTTQICQRTQSLRRTTENEFFVFCFVEFDCFLDF